MGMADGRDDTAWDGSLPELLAFLAEGSFSARVHVREPQGPDGHVDVVAGGVADARAGDLRGDEAVATLTRRTTAKLSVEMRLPHPTELGLDPPADRTGSLAGRPVAALMRYCEEFVLSCALVLERKDEVARIVYRRGEITATVVDGSDAPHRLPEVMGWTDGSFRIDLAPPERTRKTAKKPVAATEVSTLFGYPNPTETVAAMAAAASSARPGERATPKVPVAAVDRETPFTRSTPRASAPVATTASATPAPVATRTAENPAVLLASNSATTRVTVKTAATAATPARGIAADVDTPTPRPAAPLAPRPTTRSAARVHAESDAELADTGYLAQPVIVHVIIGVALGLLAVAGYWAYLRNGGTPLI